MLVAQQRGELPRGGGKENRRGATTIQPGPSTAEPDVTPGLGGGPLPAPG